MLGICLECRKEFTKNNKKQKSCSTQCAGLLRRGNKNPHWKGGKHHRKDGYILVRDGSMSASVRGKRYTLFHRLVMEKHLGRKLGEWEIVHHKNGDRKDNRIENLEVITQAEHARRHDGERKKNKLGQYA